MTQLQRTLTEIGERTPTYDVLDRAVAGATRRRRRRRWAGSAAVLLAVASAGAGTYALGGDVQPAATSAAPSPSAPAPSPGLADDQGPVSCSVSVLPVPRGYPKKSIVTGADPTGRLVLGRLYPSTGVTAAVWTDGVVAVVDLPGTDDTLDDVNSAGLAVGTSFEGDHSVAWAYDKGKATKLAGRDAAAVAVNERGVIVGNVGDTPVVWRSVTAEPEPLRLPTGTEAGTARDIDEDGTVVGTAGPKLQPNGIDDGRAYAWGPDGAPQELRLPETTPDGRPTGSIAVAVRNGWVSGAVTVTLAGGFSIQPAQWNLGAGDVKLTPGLEAERAVNASGWLAGRGKDGLVLVTGSHEVPLPLPRGAKYDRMDAVGTLSDDGTTVAGNLNPVHDLAGLRALVWICR